MNLLAKLCITGLACLLPFAAQAELLTYRYTATINGVDISDGDLADLPFRAGDRLVGTFAYDTAAKLAPFQDDPSPYWSMANYELTEPAFMNYQVERTGYSFASTPLASLRSFAHVWDSYDGQVLSDQFEMMMWGMDDQFDISMHTRFLLPATTFQNTSMPAVLDPATVEVSALFGNFIRKDGLGWMNFYADITSLEQVSSDVPEPGSLLLLAAGASGLLASRRRKRTALLR